VRRWALTTWVAFALACGYVAIGPLTHDFRDTQLRADEASFVLQALSLAYDGPNLSFDHKDIERWRALDWAPTSGDGLGIREPSRLQPIGLFFKRYQGEGWAFAKPYGYSLYLMPFTGPVGAGAGVSLANTALLLVLVGLSIAMLRLRYRGPEVPLLVAALLLASYARFYAYVPHSELFLATVVGIAFCSVLYYWHTERLAYAFLAFGAIGFGVSEKLAFAVLFAPVVLLILWKERRLAVRLALPAVGAAVLLISVIPYLHYSSWSSPFPYSGERYYAHSSVPFAEGAGYRPTQVEEAGELSLDLGNRLEALAFYFAGRHTGMLVFIPIGALLLAAVLARARRLDLRAAAVLAGVLGYILFYVVLFTDNYYGGAHSLGDRYFLQMMPSLVALAVIAQLGRRLLVGLALAGIALGLLFQWPHHTRPERAFVEVWRTSAPQRAMPFESNQKLVRYFLCREDFCPSRGIQRARALPQQSR
jgi:hypothetical protein